VCVRVCVCVCVRACACVHACVSTYFRAYVSMYKRIFTRACVSVRVRVTQTLGVPSNSDSLCNVKRHCNCRERIGNN